MLTLHFTRVSPTHHRFEYRRKDDTGESVELETKSFLVHDFIHFCIEHEGKRKEGFYGLIEQGHAYAELTQSALSTRGTMVGTKESADIEILTGPFTSLIKGEGVTVGDVRAGLQNIFSAHKEEVPSWMTEDMLTRAEDRYRRLMGAWGSLKFGETLTLEFGTR